MSAIDLLIAHEEAFRFVRGKKLAQLPEPESHVTRQVLELYRDNRRKLYTRLRELRMAAAVERGTHTHGEWLDLCRSLDQRCAACHRTGLVLHKDHITPISAGGSDAIDNIQPLCKRCNSKKSTGVTRYTPPPPPPPRIKIPRGKTKTPSRPDLRLKIQRDEVQANLYWRNGHPIARFTVSEKLHWIALGPQTPTAARAITSKLATRAKQYRRYLELTGGASSGAGNPNPFTEYIRNCLKTI